MPAQTCPGFRYASSGLLACHKIGVDMDQGLAWERPALFKCRAPSGAITRARREDRDGDELIGICRGLIADGNINQLEAKYLLDWIDRHREFRAKQPFATVYRRVSDALETGVLDGDEERDLLAAVHGLVGGEADDLEGSLSLATQLPLDMPPPEILFPDHNFVVTGVFAFGDRRAVVDAIANAGGVVKSSVSRLVHYLIIGSVGSRDWIHSSFGRKIEAAVELKENGAPVAIVSEDPWRTFLK